MIDLFHSRRAGRVAFLLFFLALAGVSAQAALAHDRTLAWNPAGQTLSMAPNAHLSNTFDQELAAALRAHPDAQALVVSGPGGSLNAALRAARLANDHGVAVYAVDDCVSACAMLWVAARQREMKPQARIGLHQARPGNEAAVDLWTWVGEHVEAQKRTLLADAGFPAAAIDVALATPPTAVAWFTFPELRTLGVRVGTWQCQDARGVKRPAGRQGCG